jgi:ABC-type proline/glycine betaine transport system permease subunit
LGVEHTRLRTHLHSMLGLLELPTALVHPCSELLMVSRHHIHKGTRMALSRLASLLHVVYVHVWSANADTLEGTELRIGTLQFCVVIGHELLNHV